MTKTIELAGKTYSIKGELPNGAFYLEGPRGGDAVFAKATNGAYVFSKAKGGAVIHDAGVLVTATRAQLAA